MLRHKRAVVAIVAVVATIGLIAIGSSSSAQIGSSGKEVVVVNTPTVSAQQSGQWNVGIAPTANAVNVTNPVQVINGGGNPLLVRSADPVMARRPFQKFLLISLGPGDVSTNGELIEVPAGERLVIEFVTLFATFIEDSWLHIVLSLSGDGEVYVSHHFVPAHDRIIANSIRRVIHMSEMTRLTAAPGTTLNVHISRGGSTSEARSVQITLAGYFEAVPSANQN
jgi:hypothetical protein